MELLSLIVSGPNKQDSDKHERGNQLLFVRYQTLMDWGKPNFCSIETDKTRMRGVSIVGDNDDTRYAYSGRRHHDRAVTGLWLVSLHDEKRGTCQIPQGASCLGRHQSLLDIRNSARPCATLTCGRTCAFHATRTHGGAGAFLPTRNQ